MKCPTLQVSIMRHGATASNEAYRYCGKRTNEALSAKGQTQAESAGCMPWVPLVYTSPLLRAQQTAHICFPHAAIESVPGLEEYDFGIFEGRTADEMENDAAYRSWVDSHCQSRCPEGESRAEYMNRSNAALESILHDAYTRGDQQVFVVAHGGTIMAAFSAFACSAEAQDYFAWQVDPACGYTAQVNFQGGQPQLSCCTPFTTLPPRIEQGVGAL